MRVIEPAKLRNIGLFGHGSTGKTTLLEAILYTTGLTTRMGRVEDGNTVSDFEAEEKAKGYSISTSLAYCDWNKHRLNFIDTPGGANFFAEAGFSLQVSDGVLLAVCAASGVEVGTEKVWNAAAEKGMPRVFFINKLDRERANFDATIKDIQDSFKINLVVLQLPIGQEANFEGIADVISGKAYKFDDKGLPVEMTVPAGMADRIAEARVKALESIAENDEALMEKYLGGEELSNEDVFTVLRKSVAAGEAFPVLCGSATKCAGIPLLLDFLVSALPSPLDHSTWKGTNPNNQQEEERISSPDAPFSAVVFKTNSSFAGTMSMIRIASGNIAIDGSCYNSKTTVYERLSLVKIQGKNTESIDEAVLGDLVGVAKMKNTHTGDTLCDEKKTILYSYIVPPTPSISFSVQPKVKGDEDKVIGGLLKIAEDDPTVRVTKDAQTKEVILSGMGTGHIEVTMDKLVRRYKIEATLGTPKVPYLETIKGKANSRYRHRKQSGGRGQFGECEIVIYPLPRGGGYEFHDKIFGGVISKTFIPAVDKGIREAAENGVLAGYPTVDFQVDLIDGKMHDVDSSEMAFKIAGSMAFKQGILDLKPCLLEPIQKLEIIVPEENTGDIMGDLSSRRGQVQGFEAKGKNTVIRALVPLAEILRYEPDLRSMTSGRGLYASEFDHYQEVPHELAQKIIELAAKAREEQKE
jgi:elongation factor G